MRLLAVLMFPLTMLFDQRNAELRRMGGEIAHHLREANNYTESSAHFARIRQELLILDKRRCELRNQLAKGWLSGQSDWREFDLDLGALSFDLAGVTEPGHFNAQYVRHR